MTLKMKYFVLKPSGSKLHAAASRRAMNAYAEWLVEHSHEPEDHALANELFEWARDEAMLVHGPAMSGETDRQMR